MPRKALAVALGLLLGFVAAFVAYCILGEVGCGNEKWCKPFWLR